MVLDGESSKGNAGTEEREILEVITQLVVSKCEPLGSFNDSQAANSEVFQDISWVGSWPPAKSIEPSRLSVSLAASQASRRRFRGFAPQMESPM